MRDRFRLRFSVLTIMIVIALIAGGFAWLRPLTADEAVRIATDRFQRIPGAEAWKDCPTRSVQTNRGNWCVDFIDPATGQSLVQIMVDMRGKPGGAYIPVPGGRASIAVPETLPRMPPPQP
jgi:hypothetical protein